MNNGLSFILFSFNIIIFPILFYFIFGFILLFFILNLDKICDVTSYVTATYVTIIQTCDIEKNIKNSRTNNII